MRVARIRALGGLTVALCGLLTLPAATACEICRDFFTDLSCGPVFQGETGYTECEPSGESSSCEVSGDFCSVITVDGGGGGGGTGGGGGDNPCETLSFCPAECFSCGGGGGRPRPVV